MNSEQIRNNAVKKLEDISDSLKIMSHVFEQYSDGIANKKLGSFETLSALSLRYRTSEDIVSESEQTLSLQHEMAFQSLFNVFEAAVFDLLSIYYVRNPECLSKNKQLTFGEVIESASYNNVVNKMVAKELNSIAYDSISKWIKVINKALKFQVLDDDESGELSEMKVTRNIIVHAGSVYNEIYLETSGSYAKHAIGDHVVIDESYLINTHLLLRKVIDVVADRVEELA
ncbi:hypothetical protein [Aliivibrio sp. SR45-2]|uniref:hypothetical protein n=1 Tax=Aliivibrio sp. SR45-2 TaxID=2760931 RepID=UPI0015F97794|nr:hypothetical protein [Aliivibrio sp. SR45-2]MBB1314938.1 hypothetical protein [Aliivibrio sp. SR45-2]